MYVIQTWAEIKKEGKKVHPLAGQTSIQEINYKIS